MKFGLLPEIEPKTLRKTHFGLLVRVVGEGRLLEVGVYLVFYGSVVLGLRLNCKIHKPFLLIKI